MIKKVTAIALALSILVSGAAYAEKKEVIEVSDQTNYSVSFDDEKEWFKEIGVSAVDMAKLETLFKEAIALEENEKDTEAESKWAEFDIILENYFDEADDVEFTFEDEKEWLEELEVSASDMVLLEMLYKEAIQLEENDNEVEAKKKWDVIDDILENYFDEEVYTFEDEKEWLTEFELDAKVISELEILFNEARALEEAEKDDAAEVKWEAYYTVLDKHIDMLDMDYNEEFDFTIEDENEWLESLGVSAEDKIKLESLYNDLNVLEESGKESEAEVTWTAIITILDKYNIDEDYELTPEKEWVNEKKWLNEVKVSPSDISKLEVLYKQVIELEENNKMEEAEAKWMAYEAILNPYIVCNRQ